MTSAKSGPLLPSGNLLGIEGLSPAHVTGLLDLAESYVAQSRAPDKKTALLKGRTLINLFFEASTRTPSSLTLRYWSTEWSVPVRETSFFSSTVTWRPVRVLK